MRNFLDSVELSDLVKSVDRRRETSMEGENLVFNDSSEGKVVEKLCESFPDIGVSVLSEAFIIKAISKREISQVKFVLTPE